MNQECTCSSTFGIITGLHGGVCPQATMQTVVSETNLTFARVRKVMADAAGIRHLKLIKNEE